MPKHTKLPCQRLHIYAKRLLTLSGTVSGGYNSRTKVERLTDNLWLIDGTRVKYSGESFWYIDLPRTYNPESVFKWALEKPPEPSDDTFEVLRHIAERVKGKLFLSFYTDGSWGPIVSNPRLLIHVLKWIFTKPYVVER